jgi:hypothetical protein
LDDAQLVKDVWIFAGQISNYDLCLCDFPENVLYDVATALKFIRARAIEIQFWTLKGVSDRFVDFIELRAGLAKLDRCISGQTALQ